MPLAPRVSVVVAECGAMSGGQAGRVLVVMSAEASCNDARLLRAHIARSAVRLCSAAAGGAVRWQRCARDGTRDTS